MRNDFFQKWILPMILFAVGLICLWGYFFAGVPKKEDLIQLNGRIVDYDVKRGRYSKKLFHVDRYRNRFEEHYLKNSRFEDLMNTGDQVVFQIRKIDFERLYFTPSIGIWSLEINNNIVYTAQQRIYKETFFKNYILPLMGCGFLLVSILIFRYTKKKKLI